LVAFIQGELSPDRLNDVRAHLETCAECREAHDEFVSVFKVVRDVPRVEPSSAFDDRLKERLAFDAGTPPSSRPSSRATVRLVEPQVQPARRARWRYTAMAAAIVFLSLTLTQFFFFGGRASDPLGEIKLAEKRWLERRDAPTWERILTENRISLPAEVTSSDTLVMVSHYNSKTHEDCIVAYTDDDFDALRESPDVSSEELEHVLSRSEKVVLQQGSYAIPRRFLPRLGGDGGQVTVVKLANRFEIWSVAAYQRYTQAGPQIETVPTDDAEPPAERDKSERTPLSDGASEPDSPV
jgi:hypothetical protein